MSGRPGNAGSALKATRSAIDGARTSPNGLPFATACRSRPPLPALCKWRGTRGLTSDRAHRAIAGGRPIRAGGRRPERDFLYRGRRFNAGNNLAGRVKKMDADATRGGAPDTPRSLGKAAGSASKASTMPSSSSAYSPERVAFEVDVRTSRERWHPVSRRRGPLPIPSRPRRRSGSRSRCRGPRSRCLHPPRSPWRPAYRPGTPGW